MNADTIFFSAWLAFVVAVFADFAVRELRPPATCAELVRRLKAIAVPLHGQSHHDVRLAAATLEAIDNSHWIANSAIDIVRHNDRSLYHTEPEGTR